MAHLPLSPECVEIVSSLFLKYRRQVFSFFYSKLGDKDLSEDMVSEVFIKVARAIDKKAYVDEGKPIIAWIMKISRNFLMDHYRRKKKEAVIPPSSKSDALIFASPEKGLGKDEYIQNVEISEEVRGLLDLLPPEQREVVIMRIYLDLPFKEIAEIEGVGINTALGRMRYALINLRRMIRERSLDLSGYKMPD
ncbi:MAG: hypothetical protein QG551_221 [Patescibacteria group bacterium]|jgi:RNA polymerase sigma-70 factor (ECF subfamily)|nr:hypothetical protein [Patescibacteria group bacterium]